MSQGRIDSETMRRHLSLYLVMGSNNCQQPPLQVLQEAIQGGITLFQFREKGTGALQVEDKLELARHMQALCRSQQIPFIVNDDLELMLALDADGIHIGQEDAPIEQVRQQIGDKILGVSAHNPEEALLALELGADYLGVGPMYATATKSDIREVRGPQVVTEIRQAGVGAPIVGIGGITSGRIHPVIAAGADGVAVVSAISQADAPQMAAKQLQREVFEACLLRKN